MMWQINLRVFLAILQQFPWPCDAQNAFAAWLMGQEVSCGTQTHSYTVNNTISYNAEDVFNFRWGAGCISVQKQGRCSCYLKQNFLAYFIVPKKHLLAWLLPKLYTFCGEAVTLSVAKYLQKRYWSPKLSWNTQKNLIPSDINFFGELYGIEKKAYQRVFSETLQFLRGSVHFASRRSGQVKNTLEIQINIWIGSNLTVRRSLLLQYTILQRFDDGRQLNVKLI